ncbi:isoprenyl transferase [Oceanidesulfovibrio marinus]|uniref:Isoprenyl transferase n=2 Tax=Oceanidesulfovibrio marinus TaxID=370038 RepID=A0ABX6NKS7_9BACT|nr:isoprenyl transferase [Oceanidesulfovibrio marinus]
MPAQDIVPAHLAVIMDGNGRWAKQRGLPRSEGHKAGSETAKRILDACHARGIRHLTLYTFSRENWSRPKDEVSFLFDLLQSFIKRELGKLVEKSVQLRVLGELEELPFATRQALRLAINKTRGGQSMILNLALNYSGRDEILRACRRLMTDGVSPEEITEEAFSQRLYTAGQPDPDLIIRTSGELRLSNYLLFQAAYSEFYFTDKLWPDFDEAELDIALANYASRQRRFGSTSEQVGTKE